MMRIGLTQSSDGQSVHHEHLYPPETPYAPAVKEQLLRLLAEDRDVRKAVALACVGFEYQVTGDRVDVHEPLGPPLGPVPMRLRHVLVSLGCLLGLALVVGGILMLMGD